MALGIVQSISISCFQYMDIATTMDINYLYQIWYFLLNTFLLIKDVDYGNTNRKVGTPISNCIRL